MIGYRSKDPQKMIVATTYYTMCFLGFKYGVWKGVAFAIIFLNLPVLVFSVYEGIKTKQYKLLHSLGVWLVAVGLAAVLFITDTKPQSDVNEDIKDATTELTAVASETTEPVLAEDGEVFITPSGEKYHKSDCRFAQGKECISMSVREAVENGKSPCGICYE